MFFYKFKVINIPLTWKCEGWCVSRFYLLPTSQPSEDARLARRQRIVPREGCCMQKNSRSTYKKCKCKCKCKV